MCTRVYKVGSIEVWCLSPGSYLLFLCLLKKLLEKSVKVLSKKENTPEPQAVCWVALMYVILESRVETTIADKLLNESICI